MRPGERDGFSALTRLLGFPNLSRMSGKSGSGVDVLSLPQQNYVEAIAALIQQHGHAHAAEVARALKVRKPSVTEAVSRLVDLGFARRQGQEILLTARGRGVARELTDRHETLRRFMADTLGMGAREADDAACRLEHSAGPEFVGRLLLLERFLQLKRTAGFRRQWREFLDAASAREKRGARSNRT